MALPRGLRSLAVRNYRLWFLGQVVSTAGTWAQIVAQAVLVLRLSDDNGLAAGASVGTQYLPTLLLGAWGGLLADRFDKRRVLMVTQAFLALPALALAVLDLTDVIELWMVYALVGLSGMATPVDHPTRQSLVSELVGPADLQNAVGLNAAVMNSARIVGPSIAAVVITIGDTGACFLVNAFSYLATLLALSRMRPAEMHASKRVARSRGQVREGMRYAWSQPLLRANLIVMAFVGVLAFNFNVVLPLLAKVTFGGNERAVSSLFVAQGIGAVAGALTVASLSRTDGRRLAVSASVLGVAMCAASLAPTLPVFLPLMVVVGAAMMFVTTTSISLIQLGTEPAMRGRVSSLRSMVVLGSTPIGGMLTGAISEVANPRLAFALGGMGALVSLLFAAPLLRDRPAGVDAGVSIEASAL